MLLPYPCPVFSKIHLSWRSGQDRARVRCGGGHKHGTEGRMSGAARTYYFVPMELLGRHERAERTTAGPRTHAATPRRSRRRTPCPPLSLSLSISRHAALLHSALQSRGAPAGTGRDWAGGRRAQKQKISLRDRALAEIPQRLGRSHDDRSHPAGGRGRLPCVAYKRSRAQRPACHFLVNVLPTSSLCVQEVGRVPGKRQCGCGRVPHG